MHLIIARNYSPNAFIEPNKLIVLADATAIDLINCSYWQNDYQRDETKKSNLVYNRGITPKHRTSGEAHLRDIAPGQHRNVAAVASRW